MAASQNRFVIVNADDFGLTTGINRGIIETHEHGIVTSASLMVRYAAAAEAADYARANPKLSLGLHVDLAEWRYENGEWTAAYQVVDTENAAAVAEECRRQLAQFTELRGGSPTHLDSHQHVHLAEPVRSVLVGLAEELNVPLRSCSELVKYCGSFYGQTGEGEPYPTGISLDTITEAIENLSSEWTEIGCHPGFADVLDSVYALEREEEVRVLCNSAIREALDRNEVRLRSFLELPPDR